MLNMNYWEECISEAFIEVGISATQEQIEQVAEFVEVSHDNYGMFTGSDVATSNYHAEKESKHKREIVNLEMEQQRRIDELEKRQEGRENALWRRIRTLEDEVNNFNNSQ